MIITYVVLCVILLFNKVTSYSNNPEEDSRLNIVDLLEKYGNPCERHNVQTEDGYILELHRMYSNISNIGEPIIIMHGIFASSIDWIILGPGSSPGYLLSDAGYDIWLTNARGSRYSKNHTSLNIYMKEFWDFSWHEIGYYDYSSIIDYVINITGRSKVHIMAHSQGVTSFIVLLSSRPQYNELIDTAHLLSPVVFITKSENPIYRILADVSELISKFLGITELFPNLSSVQRIIESICGHNSQYHIICKTIYKLIPEIRNINATMVPVILAHSPAGSSSKQIYHYAQNINSDRFQQYNYGPDENIKRYNSTQPPVYNITSITSKLHLYYSVADDRLSTYDVYKLHKQLVNTPPSPYRISDTTFSHFDFVWGNNVYDEVLIEMLKRIKK